MITTLVYFFSAIIIILALLMSLYNWKINKNVLFLSLFLIVMTLETTAYSVYVYGGSLNFYTFLFVIAPLFLLKAPMIFFFVRGIAQDRFYFKWIDLLHFIPFLIHLSANIPYLMTSLDEKIAISTYALDNIENFKNLDINPFYPNSWNLIVRKIQLLVYIIACFVLIRTIKQKFLNLTGQLKYQYDYTVHRLKMLLYLIILIAIIQIILIFLYFNEIVILSTTGFGTSLIVVEILVYFSILLFVLLCPKMLYGMPHLETKHVSAYQFEEKHKKKVADQ